jgi:hypothetical protein
MILICCELAWLGSDWMYTAGYLCMGNEKGQALHWRLEWVTLENAFGMEFLSARVL